MKELNDLVNEHLDEYLQITYPEDIFKAMKYTLMLPGKRLQSGYVSGNCKNIRL